MAKYSGKAIIWPNKPLKVKLEMRCGNCMVKMIVWLEYSGKLIILQSIPGNQQFDQIRAESKIGYGSDVGVVVLKCSQKVIIWQGILEKW